MPGMIDLIIKFMLLFLLNVEIELFLRSKRYSLAVFFSGVWATVFRLTLLRAMSMYIGVFGYQSSYTLLKLRDTIQGIGWSLAIDSLLLIGTILVFYSIKRSYLSDRFANLK